MASQTTRSEKFAVIFSTFFDKPQIVEGIYRSLTSGIILSIKWEWMAHAGKENCTLCKISFGTKMCCKAIECLLRFAATTTSYKLLRMYLM